MTKIDLNFRLHVGEYTGNAGDSLSWHNNMPFTTKDRDNDPFIRNCAHYQNAGWWFNMCAHSNLNGVYYRWVIFFDWLPLRMRLAALHHFFLAFLRRISSNQSINWAHRSRSDLFIKLNSFSVAASTSETTTMEFIGVSGRDQLIV